MRELILPLNNSRKKKLLGFTGIFSLYPKALTDAKVEIQWLKDDQHDNEYTVSVQISCPELEVLLVRIDGKNKIVKNVLVINRLSENGVPVSRGAAFRCFAVQVKFAAKHNYKYIELDALRVDNNNFKFDGKNYTLIGYKEFGRYGFTMPRKNEREFFRNIIKNNTNHSIKYISELYSGDLQKEECKSVWALFGDSWNGKFDLYKNSFSRNYLDDLLNVDDLQMK